ncbi:MAG: cysteine--tRNA ligase, partial [Alphaproteobacteria bacterium]|nr:cysteine--tRNA ligase [Alphaproteobacteria bacterium]
MANTFSLKFFNTLSRVKEDFHPIDPHNVRIYVCGPTVYDYAHIGNARPVVVFDTLFRLLRHKYGIKNVTYVRNITDIDDRIIQIAQKNNEDIKDLTTRTIDAYHQDMYALNALLPTFEPKATDYIDAMIDMIQGLIDKKYAYVADGHVLFHVPSMDDYGQLSQRSLDEMIAGARVEIASYKKHPADFVLWKPSTDDQPGWDSPWVHGRPGWHIECSAMSASLLGETFDIHGGGLDLIFPHHENEIAQSQCYHKGKPLAKFWMHNGFVQVNNEKMSKSLGNFFTVRDLLEKGFAGETIRLALLSGHYRQPIDITEKTLHDAKSQLDRFYLALRDCPTNDLKNKNINIDNIFEALGDDLNIPLALSHLHEMVTQLNKENNLTKKSELKNKILYS